MAAKGRLLAYHWKMGPANDGSCGEQTWGLFEPDGPLGLGSGFRLRV